MRVPACGCRWDRPLVPGLPTPYGRQRIRGRLGEGSELAGVPPELGQEDALRAGLGRQPQVRGQVPASRLLERDDRLEGPPLAAFDLERGEVQASGGVLASAAPSEPKSAVTARSRTRPLPPVERKSRRREVMSRRPRYVPSFLGCPCRRALGAPHTGLCGRGVMCQSPAEIRDSSCLPGWVCEGNRSNEEIA